MNDTTKPTKEQVAADALAAKQAAEKAEAEKVAKAAKKAEKESEAAAKKAEAETKKAAKAAEKEAAKAKVKADKASKLEAKVAAKAAKEANRQPEQNGVRRPGPDGKCGKAWAVFDELSSKINSPVAIADALVVTKAQGQNDTNVRCEYARWKKFNGISGRIAKVESPKADADQAAQ